MDRRRWAAVVTGALALVTTAATFGPWAASGTKVRTSYAVVDIVERAGVLSSSWAGLSGIWYFVPALCGLVLISVALARFVIGAVLAATLGALVATGGLLVTRSPLVVEPGARVGTFTGVCTVLAGAVSLGITMTTRRNDE